MTKSQINPGATDEIEILKYVLLKYYLIVVLVHQSQIKKSYTNATKLSKINKIKTNKWSTKAGTFYTITMDKSKLKLPEYNQTMEISVESHLTDKSLNYDLILGRDILHKLGIIFNPKNNLIRSFNLNETTKLYGKCFLHNQRKTAIRKATKRTEQILDAEYKKINLKGDYNLKIFQGQTKNFLIRITSKKKNCLMEP